MKNKNFEQSVSIIIPSRNADYLLKECIEKIRELYNEVHIVLVLDEIGENSLGGGEKNITVLKSTNPNMSAKRNQGVYSCKTEYIAFLDSDAYPCRNQLETGVAFLEENQSYSAVTGCQYNPPSDKFEQICLRLVRFSPLFTHKEWLSVTDRNVHPYDCEVLMTSNVIMRRFDYIKINGMNENIYLAEDSEFSWRLIKNGYRIRFIPQVSVFHHECTLYPFLRKVYLPLL